ncbi:MAG: sensor histidine kinase, partial [Thermodesulfobacteriota bacterium]
MPGSIAKKFLFAQIALIAAITILLGLLSAHFFGEYLLDDQREHLALLSQAAAQDVAAKISRYRSQSQILAEGNAVQIYSEKFQEQLLIGYFSRFRNDFPKIAYVNEQGEEEVKVVGGVAQEKIGTRAAPTILAEAEVPNRPHLVPQVFVDPDLRTAAIHFAYARRHYFGDTFQGLVVATVPLSSLTSGIDTINRPRSIRLFLVDGAGTILHGGSPGQNSRLLLDGRPFAPRATMFSGRAALQAVDSHYTAAPVAGSPWWLVASQPHADFIAPLARLRLTLAAYFVLILALSTFASHRLARGITRPLKQLTTAAQEIAHGELAQKITVESGDEVAELARSFNRMSEELVSAAAREQELLRTEAQARLAAEMANQQKGLFLTNMNHELRTPITGIMGMAQLLEQTELSREQRDYVATMLESSEHLLQIVETILSFATIETGALELAPVLFEPRRLIADLAALYQAKFGEKGLDFSWEVDQATPARLIGDQDKLRLVLQNLLANACNFTDTGVVAITVGPAAPVPDAHGRLRLRFVVSDTGIGIPEEQQRAVFEQFTQADMTISRKIGGLGLGLSITRRLVGLMLGDLVLNSRPGQGTTVTVTIPFAVPAAAGAPPPP